MADEISTPSAPSTSRPEGSGPGLQALADARRVDAPAALAAADASSFAARRFASSVSRRSMPSTIAMCACCSSLSPSGARLCLAALPASAPPTSVGWRAPSSRLATSLCCPLQPATRQEIGHGSHSERRCQQARPARRCGEGRRRLWPQFSAAAEARHGSDGRQQSRHRADEAGCCAAFRQGKIRG